MISSVTSANASSPGIANLSAQDNEETYEDFLRETAAEVRKRAQQIIDGLEKSKLLDCRATVPT